MRSNADTIPIEECRFIENTSSIYKNGSVWETNKCGKCTIVGLLEKRKGAHIFLVEFEDGTRVKARHSNIKNGNVSNPYHYGNVCGIACLGNANSKHFLYSHWSQMVRRCYDKTHIKYMDYGGRGIKVCKRWLCFEYFLKDIQCLDNYEKLKDGRRFQIDRINNNADYSIDNCKVVTVADNCRNRRSNSFVKVIRNNEVIDIMCVYDVSKKYKIDRKTIRAKVKSGDLFGELRFITSSKMEEQQWREKHSKN